MARIIVFSDTHGNLRGMRDVILHHGPFDMMFHLGDGIQDGVMVSKEVKIPFYGVCGNEDFFHGKEFPSKKLVKIHSWSFLLVHGHQMEINPYQSKELWEQHLTEMSRWAKRERANVFLFGHTHAPLLKHIKDIFICNPGDQFVGSSFPPSCALINAKEDSLDIAILRKKEGGWENILDMHM